MALVHLIEARRLLLAKLRIKSVYLCIAVKHPLFEPVHLLAEVLTLLGGNVSDIAADRHLASAPPLDSFDNALQPAERAYQHRYIAHFHCLHNQYTPSGIMLSSSMMLFSES